MKPSSSFLNSIWENPEGKLHTEKSQLGFEPESSHWGKSANHYTTAQTASDIIPTYYTINLFDVFYCLFSPQEGRFRFSHSIPTVCIENRKPLSQTLKVPGETGPPNTTRLAWTAASQAAHLSWKLERCSKNEIKKGGKKETHNVC